MVLIIVPKIIKRNLAQNALNVRNMLKEMWSQLWETHIIKLVLLVLIASLYNFIVLLYIYIFFCLVNLNFIEFLNFFKFRQAFPSGERVTYTGKIVLCSKCSNLPDENNTQSHSVTGNWQKLICLDHSTVLIFFDFFFCKFLFYLECSRCFQELKEGQAVIALDRQWHVWCFKCTDCGVPLHGEFMGK